MLLLESLLSVLAPFSCVGCTHEGGLLCSYCAYEMPSIPSRCYRCQAVTSDHTTCAKCRRVSSIKHVWIRTVYEGCAEEVVRAYKFNRAMAASHDIAEQMNEVLPFLSRDTLIISVPTATHRRRLRGYDHAALLARRIAHKQKLLLVKPLTRVNQSRQVGASRKQRFMQLQEAFCLIRPELIRNKRILLIDDVVTTGATLETIATLLKQAGALEVNALVFAQKL